MEGNPFELQEVSDLLSEIIEYKDALKNFSLETLKSDKTDDIVGLNDFLLTTIRKLNSTIGRVSGWHEANYLSRLEWTREYIMIESLVRKLGDMPIMKTHPRTLATLEECDDAPDELVGIVGAILELKRECKKLGSKINEEIEYVTNSLKETMTDLKAMLTMTSE